MDNMTALVSAFARAHHYKNNSTHVFADPFAQKILTDEEYMSISQNMSQGISFFAPGFAGTPEEALRFIVDHQLAPSVLARSAFCEKALANANGCAQVVLYASGYDTFSLRHNDTHTMVFELDQPSMIEDKKQRLAQRELKPVCHVEFIGCDLSQPSWKEALLKAGFQPTQASFGSLLGISYYLSKDDFKNLVNAISSIACNGSFICFDYPQYEDGKESQNNRQLAAAAGEPMKAKYSHGELKSLLQEAGFKIVKHMDASEATDVFFREYNAANAMHAMAAPKGVGYCLAIRQA